MLHFFFFNDSAPTEIYTLSLHYALPISLPRHGSVTSGRPWETCAPATDGGHGSSAAFAISAARSGPGGTLSPGPDRKSTRLNSSHMSISYAVFCLKKKKQQQKDTTFNEI